jgi:phage shock protein C
MAAVLTVFLIVFLISFFLPLIILYFVYKALGIKKSRTNKILFGVCGGVGESLGINANIIRIILVILIFGFGAGVGLYLASIFAMPKA